MMQWVETILTKAAAMATSREVVVTEAELVAVAAVVAAVVTVAAAMVRTHAMRMAATHNAVATTTTLVVEVAARGAGAVTQCAPQITVATRVAQLLQCATTGVPTTARHCSSQDQPGLHVGCES